MRTLKQGMNGTDVRELQEALNARAKARHEPISLDPDGDLGGDTMSAYRTIAFDLGLTNAVINSAEITIGAQRVILDPTTRTSAQLDRAKERKKHNSAAPRPELTVNVVNQSSRNNAAKPRLIVLHTTEGHDRPGVEDLRGLIALFNDRKNETSSHVGNDQEGNDSRMVPDSQKAFTQAGFNSVSLSIEQIGFARFSRDEWLRQRSRQVDNTAAWIAFWSTKHAIPIRHARVDAAGRVMQPGVIRHSELGALGGGHSDPGAGYPFEDVLERARRMQ
jgi:hypothetical protein